MLSLLKEIWKKKLKGEDSHGQQHHSKPGYLFSFKL